MHNRFAIAAALAVTFIPLIARADWDGRSVGARDPLPAPFSFTTGSAALRTLFPSYVAATGTVTSPRTKQGHPAHVILVDAKPWFANRSDFLVIVVEREKADREFELDQCGACWRALTIAVLRRTGGALAVVARTEVGDAYTRAAIFQDLEVKGDGDGRLDLVPYRLSVGETLLGYRNTVDAMGTSRTTESLLRIVGGALVPVAYIPMGDSGWGGGVRDEQTSTIAVVPSDGRYASLRVTSTTYRCPVSIDVQCSESAAKHLIGVRSAIYRFDGKAYRTGTLSFPEVAHRKKWR